MDHDTFWGLTQTAWTAIYTLLNAALLMVAVTAALYARGQWLSTKDQVRDSRAAQLEANRPYVTVTVEPGATSMHLFDLVVRNIGQRPAFAVSVVLDPAPARARAGGPELSKAKMLTEPISLIAPGQEMRAFYDSHIERNDRADLPTSHAVKLSYRDSSGNEYDETAVLDIGAMKGTMFTEVKTVHHAAKSLAEIQKVLKSAAVMGRRGSLQVDAAIETREARELRLAEREAAAKLQHDELRQRLIADDRSQHPEQG